jgi:hypothetical protein
VGLLEDMLNALDSVEQYIWFLSGGLVMVAVTPTNLQKMEFDVTTAEGPSRVTVVTGVIPFADRKTYPW